jgi:hypothetical protein
MSIRVCGFMCISEKGKGTCKVGQGKTKQNGVGPRHNKQG